MLSIGLWRWYINIAITILDIIHSPVFYLKHDVSEIGFRLRLQVETTQMGTKDELAIQITLIDFILRKYLILCYTDERRLNRTPELIN
jgi:hypothetical protein